MVRSRDFWTYQLQVVAFTTKTTPVSASAFIASSIGLPNSRYTGEIQSFPVSDQFPLPDGVPLVQMASPDGAWTISAGRYRIDSRWNHAPPLQHREHPAGVNVLAACAEPLIGFLKASPDIKVDRLALVVFRAAETANPALTLIDRFCNEESRDPKSATAAFRHSQSFQIHNHKRYPLPGVGVEVNSWMRCKSAQFANSGAPIVQVEQDINTVSDGASAVFSVLEIERYLQVASAEADSVLSLYFPNRVAP